MKKIIFGFVLIALAGCQGDASGPVPVAGGASWYTRLPGGADEIALSQLGTNGFQQVDSFSSGANGTGTVWYNSSTGQCLQVITVNGRVDSAVDIDTHPKCSR